jgi:hypothetical protein
MGDRRHQSYRDFAQAIEDNGGAPCQTSPDIFFPEDFPHKAVRDCAIQAAKALCAECPIRLQCFAYAIEAQEPYGIWAGTLPHER